MKTIKTPARHGNALETVLDNAPATFDNATESAERLRALRERAERFENLAADMAAQSQKDRLIMGEMLRALEDCNAQFAAILNEPRFGDIYKASIRASFDAAQSAIAKAKTILE